VPVLVRDVPDESAAAMSLIENIQREDLNPLEEAHGLQRLVREFGHTHEQRLRPWALTQCATHTCCAS
jgi:ParB family chromosome partitioning protein